VSTAVRHCPGCGGVLRYYEFYGDDCVVVPSFWRCTTCWRTYEQLPAESYTYGRGTWEQEEATDVGDASD